MSVWRKLPEGDGRDRGVAKLSLTDPDAKLMKNKNGFAVVYNPQTAVDSETHLLRDFEMTNQVTDHGLLNPAMQGIRAETEGEILETVADKGYGNTDDMLNCLENGIIPHVITADGKERYELEIPYEETGAGVSSTNPDATEEMSARGESPGSIQRSHLQNGSKRSPQKSRRRI